MRNTEAAFHWILNILERHNIPYKISGGFAARVHGATRELADIDIDVVETDISKIAEDVKPHVIFGPARYVDANWDLELMTLRYEEQDIDIAGMEARIFNQKTRQWEQCSNDPQNIELKEVFGRNVPVESRASLIAYKTKLAREVDLEDVRQLSSLST